MTRTPVDTNDVPVTCTDAELLMQFSRRRDELAFAQLIERHGALVMGVCQQVLRHRQDAEDAFQATFILLARKAKSVRSSSVAAWLYRVAYRTAVRAAKRRMKRGESEMLEEPTREESWTVSLERQETQRAFHDALSTLPLRYRRAIVLCHLEGKTREQAAELLECTEFSVKASLARGRKLLRERLQRRGIAVSVALAAVAFMKTSPAEAARLAPRTLELCMSTINPSPTVQPDPVTSELVNEGVRRIMLSSLYQPALITAAFSGLLLVAAVAPAPNFSVAQADDRLVHELQAAPSETDELLTLPAIEPTRVAQQPTQYPPTQYEPTHQPAPPQPAPPQPVSRPRFPQQSVPPQPVSRPRFQEQPVPPQPVSRPRVQEQAAPPQPVSRPRFQDQSAPPQPVSEWRDPVATVPQLANDYRLPPASSQPSTSERIQRIRQRAELTAEIRQGEQRISAIDLRIQAKRLEIQAAELAMSESADDIPTRLQLEAQTLNLKAEIMEMEAEKPMLEELINADKQILPLLGEPVAQPPAEPSRNTGDDITVRLTAEPPKPEIIRPGMRIEIITAPDIHGAVLPGPIGVENSGQVPLGPGFRRVRIAGLSLQEAEDAITKELAKQYEDPKITLLLVPVQSRTK